MPNSHKLLILFLLGFFLGGCATTLKVSPTLPQTQVTATNPTRMGIYITRGITSELKPGSGIWPATTYSFSAEETVQDGLVDLTKRHFANAGFAENAGDKRWDYVLEYNCEKPFVADDDLRAQAPMKFILRNPQTGREVQSLTLTGEGQPQGGRFFRFFLGRLTEKGALERSLTEAYSNLYQSVDGILIRTGANTAQSPSGKPYRRR